MKHQLRLWFWAVVAAMAESARDWRCWLLHDGAPVSSSNRRDANTYWHCDCGRRWCVPERVIRHPHVIKPRGRNPDVQWLSGGDWSPPAKPPRTPPPPRSGTAAMRPRER